MTTTAYYIMDKRGIRWSQPCELEEAEKLLRYYKDKPKVKQGRYRLKLVAIEVPTPMSAYIVHRATGRAAGVRVYATYGYKGRPENRFCFESVEAYYAGRLPPNHPVPTVVP